MPLPRFARLAEPERRRVLDACLDAAAGSGVSPGALARATGLSRSAVYTWFDGRADLERAAAEYAAVLAREALGAWQPCRDTEQLWARFTAAHDRLHELLATRPGVRMLLTSALETAGAQDDPWLDAVVDDALSLGLINEPHLPLCRAATAAVIGAADRLALAGRPVSPEDLRRVLTNVWRG